jgi:hypothetical protein
MDERPVVQEHGVVRAQAYVDAQRSHVGRLGPTGRQPLPHEQPLVVPQVGHT